jgi:hypothetical protein
VREILYLIGEPGAGKSTLAAALTGGRPCHDRATPFAHVFYPDEGVIQLGRTRGRGGYPGTDALSYSVQPRVIEWLARQDHALILAEGDRLANSTFFDAALEAGWQLRLAWVRAALRATERRRGREGDPGRRVGEGAGGEVRTARRDVPGADDPHQQRRQHRGGGRGAAEARWPGREAVRMIVPLTLNRDGGPAATCPTCLQRMTLIVYRPLATPAWTWVYWICPDEHLSEPAPIPTDALATLTAVTDHECDLVQHPGVAGAAP